MTPCKSYSDREIDTMFKDIKEQLDRIEQQTTRTNGRVRVLETWRSITVGGIAVLTFFIPFILEKL
jgi:hypothetical protein